MATKLQKIKQLQGLSRWLSGKDSACSTGASGDTGQIPGLGRPPGGGNGNPLQYSGLGNPVDRGAWWASVCGVQRQMVVMAAPRCTPLMPLNCTNKSGEHGTFYYLYQSVSHSAFLTFCDPLACSLPGSTLHGILQAREWVGTGVDSHSFSKIFSRPRDQIQVSCTAGRFFTI